MHGPPLCASTSDDFEWTAVHQSGVSHLKIFQLCQWSCNRFFLQQQNFRTSSKVEVVFFCFVLFFYSPPHLPPCIIHDLAAAVGLLPVPWPIYRVARESISHGRRSANSSLWSERMNPFMASAAYDSSSSSSSSLSLADTGVAFKSTNNLNRIEYHRIELMYVVDLKLGNYAIT